VAELRELLHDAEEGLLGFDAVSPIKPFLGEGFGALSKRLEQVVFLRYRLPAWTPGRTSRHKRADRLAAASEAVHVAGWSRTGSAQHAEDQRRRAGGDGRLPSRRPYDWPAVGTLAAAAGR
jgi:hypothetical protein